MDLSDVDWVALGKGVGAALAAAGAAWVAVRRAWKRGVAELFRPAVIAEVRKASKALVEELRRPLREAVSTEVKVQTAPLREDHDSLTKDVDELEQRVARVEGAVSTLSHGRH